MLSRRDLEALRFTRLDDQQLRCSTKRAPKLAAELAGTPARHTGSRPLIVN